MTRLPEQKTISTIANIVNHQHLLAQISSNRQREHNVDKEQESIRQKVANPWIGKNLLVFRRPRPLPTGSVTASSLSRAACVALIRAAMNPNTKNPQLAPKIRAREPNGRLGDLLTEREMSIPSRECRPSLAKSCFIRCLTAQLGYIFEDLVGGI